MTNSAVEDIKPGQDILGGEIPEIEWTHGDDLCDCTFQRIGQWTNPYLGRTLRVRFCCIWAELHKQYPQFVQEIPAYCDLNTGQFDSRPAEWDSEDSDMPRALWHRHMAVKLGLPLADIRKMLEGENPPKAVLQKARKEKMTDDIKMAEPTLTKTVQPLMERKNGDSSNAGKTLGYISKGHLLAIRTLVQQKANLDAQLKEIMAEAGLVPGKQYRISDQGEVVEV